MLSFRKRKIERSREVATKTVKVSDLTGEEIQGQENLARLVVQRHPAIPEPVTLEVNPGELAGKLPEDREIVMLTYYEADAEGGGRREYFVTTEEFNTLSTDFDMETVLSDALAAQQEQEGRRRGRRGRRGTGERRPRKDYTSPDHAGEPHRGRITDEEKDYVRNNLDEVNARLERDNLRTIDPSDPEMAERYGLTG
jgi:hypothetical protein